MTRGELATLLADVHSGALSPDAAQERILQYLRQAPFEDLGFARIDHHRAVRQGCPEVVFGPGKTPNQVAAIAQSIIKRGHSLLGTRTDHAAFDAVSERLADAKFHELARTITLP